MNRETELQVVNGSEIELTQWLLSEAIFYDLTECQLSLLIFYDVT